MSTIIYKTNGDILVTINDYETDTNSSPLTLLGRGVMNSGSADQINMVKILENFCNPIYPKNSIEGQLWYNNFTSDSEGNETPTYKLYVNTKNTQVGIDGWLALADKRDIDSLKSRMGNYDSELSDIKKHLTQHDSELSQQAGQIQSITSNIDGINSSLGKLQNEIDAINTKIGVINGNLITINSSLGKLQNEIDATNTKLSNYVLKNNSTPDNNSYSGDLGNSSSHYDTIYSNIFNGTAIRANWADLAEIYESDKNYPVGTIVKIGGEKEITSTKKYKENKIIGVISRRPALLMNSEIIDNNHQPVALIGRVHVRVYGKISKGDIIISSDIEGVGICAENGCNDSYIRVGISLEDSLDTSERLVYCYVGK